MHAYLIITKDEEEAEKKIDSLTTSLRLKRFDASINKIDDVRALSSFSKLGQGKPLGIVLRKIDNASLEALNAFLKNLEEPQENINYILTSESTDIPDTIISRCKIIKVTQNARYHGAKELIKNLISNDLSFKMNFVDEVKSKDEAEDCAQKLISGAHSLLIAGWKPSKMAKIVKSANRFRNAIRANGNIQLQLLNFLIELE